MKLSHKLQRDDTSTQNYNKRKEMTNVMNSAFIIAVTSWSPLLRLRRKESISSMCLPAKLNNPATDLFDSPNHLLVNTDAAMLVMKVAFDSSTLPRGLLRASFYHILVACKARCP